MPDAITWVMVTVVTVTSPNMSPQAQEAKAFEECKRSARFLQEVYLPLLKDQKPSVRIMCSTTLPAK